MRSHGNPNNVNNPRNTNNNRIGGGPFNADPESFHHDISWKNVEKLGDIKNHINTLKTSIEAEEIRLKSHKDSLKRLERIYNNIVDAINERKEILLVNEGDLEVALLLIEKHEFNGKILVAPTGAGPATYNTLTEALVENVEYVGRAGLR